MLWRSLPGAICILLTATTLWAQPPQSKPAYDVAAIKPNLTGSGNSQTHGTKGQIVFVNQSLRRYIERAWNVATIQIAAPDWLGSLNFDITAKYPPDASPEDRQIMLQTLLEDRFKLTIHHETKEMPGYALVQAKGGIKLHPVEKTGASSSNSNGGRIQTLKATNIPMSFLADFIGRQLGQAVVDKTAAPGVYDLELRWTNDDQIPTDPAAESAPSLFTAIQETLGLRLQAEKVPVDMIVVDHIEREPSEN